MWFPDYDEKISESTDDEIWFDSDFCISVATDLLTKFTQSDWDLLKTALSQKEHVWKGRCVATLSAGDVRHAVGILIDTIFQDDMAIAVGACDSLRCILQHHKVSLPISTALNERIATLFSRAADKDMVRQLLLQHLRVTED
jgi:hypothetical protein